MIFLFVLLFLFAYLCRLTHPGEIMFLLALAQLCPMFSHQGRWMQAKALPAPGPGLQFFVWLVVDDELDLVDLANKITHMSTLVCLECGCDLALQIIAVSFVAVEQGQIVGCMHGVDEFLFLAKAHHASRLLLKASAATSSLHQTIRRSYFAMQRVHGNVQSYLDHLCGNDNYIFLALIMSILPLLFAQELAQLPGLSLAILIGKTTMEQAQING